MAIRDKKPSKRLLSRPIDRMMDEVDEDLGAAAKAAAVDKALIDLSKEEVKKFSRWVKARIDDAKASAVVKDAWDRVTTLRKEYEEGVMRTSTEMKGAHDYRTHIAASQSDSMSSRMLQVFTTDPLLKFEGRNTLGLKNAQSVEQFVDYHHDINVRLAAKGDELSTDICVEGHVVLYTPWVLDLAKDKPVMVMKQAFTDGSGKTFFVDTDDKVAVQKAKAAGAVPRMPEAYDVQEVRKTLVLKNHPDCKVFSLLDYLWAPDGKPGLDKLPSWEAVRLPYTLADLEKMEKNKQIYSGVLKKIKADLVKKKLEAGTGGETSGARGADEEGTGSDETLEGDDSDSVIYCWAVWGKQCVPGKSGLSDAITLYHDDSGSVLQTRFNPNVDVSPPMFHLRLLMLPWRWAGMGVMEMATPGERAVNDLANYILDEGRIFSCLPYKYLKNKFPGGIPPFEFWKGLGVQNMKDFEVLNFNDRRPMDINVAGFVRANTERRTGQGDLQLGRESDVTGKQPPTARGIMSILREGQVRYAKPSFGVIHELARMGQFEVKLFQQYLGSKTPVEILGDQGENLFPDGISRHQIMGSFYVTANMAAQQMSRELDAELNIQLYQLFQNNPFIAKSLSSYYEMTVDVLHSVGKRNLWVKPLSFYQQAAGQPTGDQAGQAGLSPQEQAFVQQLLQAGVPPEVARQKLEEMRNGVSPEAQAEKQSADLQLLTQGQESAA